MDPWSAISIGAPIIGGAIDWFTGRNDRKEDQSRQDDQLQRLVEDAKKAGFSPLAALGSSASGQYGTPVGGGSNASAAAGDIGRAASAIAGKPSKAQQALQTENMSLQNDLVRAQIENLNADTITARSRSLVQSQPRIDEVEALNGDDGFEQRKVVTIEPHKSSEGGIIPVPVGPDISEIAAGATIEALGNAKARREAENLYKYGTKEGPPPVPYEFWREYRKIKRNKPWQRGVNRFKGAQAHEAWKRKHGYN